MIEAEGSRIRRVAETFAAQPPDKLESRLCRAAAKLLGTAGVGFSLGAGEELLAVVLQTVCVTADGRDGERLQFDLGEGPSYTAHRTGRPVQVPDLERDDTWPAFTQAATGSGLRAVFAFPLRSGPVGLGALTLYRHVTGELSSEQYADASAVARFALNLLASVQAGRPADELEQVLTDSQFDTAELHQASGGISVQLGIPVGAALAVLRAHAFAEGTSLAEVATQVIDHRLELGPLKH